MAAPISIKEGVFRTVAAALTVGAGFVEAKQPPLACGEGEIYPDSVMPPATAEYEVAIPKKNGCAVQLYRDHYREIFLIIYIDRTEIVVYENLIGGAFVQVTGELPQEGETIDFSLNNISGSITRNGEVYHVSYTGPESESPEEEPLESEQFFRYCEPPGESLASYNERSQGSCLVEKLAVGGRLELVLVADEIMLAWLHFSAGGFEDSVSLNIQNERGEFSPQGGVAPKVGEVFEMKHNGLVVRVTGLDGGYFVTYIYRPVPKRQQPPGWPNAPFGEEMSA